MFSESRNPNVAIILVCGGCGSHFQNGRFEFSMYPILANNGDRNLMLVSISRFSGSAFLPRGRWSLLNRFRTGAGPCRNIMHEWGYIASPFCDCGESQTMRHVVNECALTCFDGGISEKTSSTGRSLQLAAETKLEIMKNKRQQQQGQRSQIE